jgi:ABC-type spermidine/putrescine transport system permease subunit I
VLRAMAALRAVCCAAVWFLLCVGIGYPVMYVVESA